MLKFDYKCYKNFGLVSSRITFWRNWISPCRNSCSCTCLWCYLAMDVQETRRFAKESNRETEQIAKDIIQHVKDLNNNSTDRFEETLNKLKKEIEENMDRIVTRQKESHIALEERSSANEKEISDKSVKNFNNLISGLFGAGKELFNAVLTLLIGALTAENEQF